MFSRTTQGIFYKVLGVGLFAPIYLAAKLSDGAFPAIALVSMRYLGGFITLWLFIAASGTPLTALRSTNPASHLARACLGIGGGAFMMQASLEMPVANATSIGLTEGMLIIALAGLLLKETITATHWIAGLVAMTGAGLVVSQSIDLSTTGFGSWQGIAAAFAAALFMALEALIIKFLSSREDALRMLLYVNGFASIISITFSMVFYGWQIFIDPALLVYLCLGPLAIIGQYFNIKAFQLVNASTLAPIIYSWILFSALLGFFLFDEIPTMVTVIGALLIVSGGVIVSRVRSH